MQNACAEPLVVMWVDELGAETEVMRLLKPGKRFSMATAIGHAFRVYWAAGQAAGTQQRQLAMEVRVPPQQEDGGEVHVVQILPCVGAVPFTGRSAQPQAREAEVEAKQAVAECPTALSAQRLAERERELQRREDELGTRERRVKHREAAEGGAGGGAGRAPRDDDDGAAAVATAAACVLGAVSVWLLIRLRDASASHDDLLRQLGRTQQALAAQRAAAAAASGQAEAGAKVASPAWNSVALKQAAASVREEQQQERQQRTPNASPRRRAALTVSPNSPLKDLDAKLKELGARDGRLGRLLDVDRDEDLAPKVGGAAREAEPLEEEQKRRERRAARQAEVERTTKVLEERERRRQEAEGQGREPDPEPQPEAEREPQLEPQPGHEPEPQLEPRPQPSGGGTDEDDDGAPEFEY